MQEGNIILMPLPQANGQIKNRPALLLKRMPPFGDALVCGISTQLQQQVPHFDELIRQQDSDFGASGLIHDSLIRLGFLAIIPHQRIIGSIGSISPSRHLQLLRNLSHYLLSS